jgi:tetratricopeptide (TPR) repeat protein
VPKQGYYQFYMAHNYHMLTFAATMQGRSEVALKTIRAMLAAVPAEWIAVKENAAVADGFTIMPMEVLKRFGRWDDILNEPDMPEFFPIARTLRHYNRGIAFAAKGQVAEARKELDALHAAAKKVDKDATFSNNKAADLFAIADKMLEGEIALRDGKLDDAIAALKEAVAREDKLRYAEPPDWFVPARHALGAVLLKAGRNEDAEKVYDEDLRRWPANGWSLYGRYRALAAQNKPSADAKSQFEVIWKDADVSIPSSCFCVEK